jgi:hypothetical protein
MVTRTTINSADDLTDKTFRGRIDENFHFFSLTTDSGRFDLNIFGTPGELSRSLQSLRYEVSKLIKEVTQNV